MINMLQRLSKPSPTNDPPPPTQAWRNDIAMLATLLFALFLGIGVRNQALNASQTIVLGDSLPRLAFPVGWLTKQADSGMLQVRNPASDSIFATEVDITVRPIETDETLETARFTQSLQRSRDLLNYRELTVDAATVQPTIGRSRSDNTPAVLATYAYVADPSLESGANDLPVVVQAQDLLFVLDNQLYVMTLAANAVDWEKEANHFKLVLASLRLEIVEQSAEEGSVQQ